MVLELPLLFCQGDGVVPLLIDLLLTLSLLKLCLLSHFLQMLLTSLLSVLFFLHLVGLSDAFFLLDRLLGLLADVLPDLEPLALLLFVPMAVLFHLDLEHFTVLRSVALLVPLDFLLTLEALLVEVHLEGFLEVALLGELVQSHFLLQFVLMAQHGTPLVEYLLL